MGKLRLKIGDKVIVRTGAQKGANGKITQVLPKEGKVVVEGVNVRTKHMKPTRTLPQGGVQKEALPIDVSKVGIVHPSDSKKASRIAYKVDKSGKKSRVYQANGKSI